MWIILFTVLALAAVYLVEKEVFIAHQLSAGAASTLEPVFSPPGDYYDRDVQLEISVPNPGVNPNVKVLFTLDGSVPTHTTGEIYAEPILINAATLAVAVVRARAVLSGGALGPVVSASYFVGVPAELPMISLIMEPGDLWDSERGIYTNFDERGDAWERPADVTYVGKDRRSGFHIQAGIRVHGGGSRGLGKKSLRLYFRQEYGTAQLEYPLFAGSEVRSFKRLVLYSGGQDHPVSYGWDWTLIRNQLADSLAFQLDGFATRSQPVLLFINGKLWGIYQISECIDSRFLADHYGIGSADFLKSPESVEQQDTLAGNRENWDHLLRFVEAHDLADPANYAYVQSQVDITNFIDYNVLQIYAADVDWPHHDVRQFRPRVQGGCWYWMFGYSDGGFGSNQYSPADSNLIERIMDVDHPETGGRDALLLRKLLENPVFFERFLSRTADLLNTTLAPRPVVAHIDVLAAELEPDIVYETIRWSSSTDWESSVQEMRDFARRRPGFVRQHIVERFNLDGTAQLTFTPPVSGSGYVAVNGTLVQNLPWQGDYFQGMPVQIMAAPTPGYRFVGWDPPDLPQTPIITLTIQANVTQTLTPRFEPVSDDAPRPGDVVFTEYHIDEDSHMRKDRFKLLVMRPGGIDLRGWRVTDNDTKTATDEGSLIFTDNPAFAHVPRGTTILVILTSSLVGGTDGGARDDLNAWDRQMVLYADNGNLDTSVDPGFNLGPNDNLVLLASGPTKTFDDDQGIAFVTESTAVTPASFGVLPDGVLSAPP